MNPKRLACRVAIAFCLSVSVPRVFAQDTITVPKSRLEELERKEAELNKLKGDLNKTKDENVELKKQHDVDAATIAETPKVIKHVSPPMNSLPPVVSGAAVDAMDLADHYRIDAATADQRYRKQKLKLNGEVVGFGSQLFLKPYRIMLKTPDRGTRLTCSIQPPEKYSAVYSIKEGSQLVGTSQRYEDEVIARLGDQVVIEGTCDGLKNSVVHMSGCALLSVHPKVIAADKH
jgi:hypothetical protein